MKKTPTQRRKLLQKKLKVRPKLKRTNNLSKVVVVKNEPLLKSTELKMQSPVFNYTKDGSMMMTHIELLDTIVSKTTTNSEPNGFNLVGYHVNAGLKTSFPFLHALAQNYKTYEFSSLNYSYIARSNYGKDGAVMFHAEYDPSVKPPENRIEFLNRSNAVEAQVFKNITYTLKPKDMKKEYTHYVRIGPLSDDQDLKLYDVANIWFGYEGTAPGSTLGDIFVTYTVKLSTPTVRLAEKQIKSIESNIGTTPIADSATVQKPFGDLNPGSFVGDFLGSLLNTATGGLSGLFFTTAKTVLKTVSMFLPNNTSSLLAGPVSNHAISILVPKGNSYVYKSDQKMVFGEDDSDILTSALLSADEDELDSKFDSITPSNVAVTANYYDASSQGRYQEWAVAWPANSLMRVVNTGNTPAGGRPIIRMTDYDGRKTNILNPNTVQFFNGL